MLPLPTLPLPTVRAVPTKRYAQGPESAQVPPTEQELDAETRPRRSYIREVALRGRPSEGEPLQKTRASSARSTRSNSTQPMAKAKVIDERYHVDGLVGEGGMARVLLATHVRLGNQVCIKQMHANLSGDPKCVERFMREVRASAKLKSAHAIRIYDVGVSRSGVPYMVMDHLDGCNLHQLVEAHGPLSAADVATMVAEACEAVGEAHDNGVVHRDLKPSNLFLSRRGPAPGTIKVLDFGVASGEKGKGPDLTQPQSFLGSPQFMAPEQARCAASASPRSDVWSLGVTMYFLLTGVVPFSGTIVGGVVSAVQQGDYVPVEQLRPDVPAFLANTIRRCLAVDPLRRPVHGKELGAILRTGLLSARDLAPYPVEAHASRRAATVRVRIEPTPMQRLAKNAAVFGCVVLTGLGALGLHMAAQSTSTVCADTFATFR